MGWSLFSGYCADVGEPPGWPLRKENPELPWSRDNLAPASEPTTDKGAYNAWNYAKKRAGDAWPSGWGTLEGFLADVGPRPHGARLVRPDKFAPWSPGNAKWSV